MHCIEIKATDFKNFKNKVGNNGGEVSIISRYTDSGVRLLDVEVSKDTSRISNLEKVFGFKGE